MDCPGISRRAAGHFRDACARPYDIAAIDDRPPAGAPPRALPAPGERIETPAGDTRGKGDGRRRDRPRSIYNQGIAEREATFETETRRGDDVRQWLAAGDALLVAERERAVLGWARAHPYGARPAYRGVRECSIFVGREARGRGVAAELLRCPRRGARAARAMEAGRTAVREQPASIALMRSCGFRDVGIHVRHGRLEGRWRDVLVVERLLGAAVGE